MSDVGGVYYWPELSHEVIATASFAGLKLANSDIQEMSGGDWVTDFSCEGFVAGCVGKQLAASLAGTHIVMEYPPHYIIETSESKLMRGRIPEKIRGSKRIDIVGYRGDRPILVGEIKKYSSRSLIKRDIERVALCVARGGSHRHGSISHGFFLGYFQNYREESNDNFQRMQSLREFLNYTSKKIGRRLSLETKIFHSGLRTGWHQHWTLWAVCVVISCGETT